MIERVLQRLLNAAVLAFPIVAAMKTENLVYLLTIIPIGIVVIISEAAIVKK